MSETPPDGPPEDPPLDPETIRRMVEDMAQVPGNAPDMATAGIYAMAGSHVQWYRGWMAAGAPEPRAAEWTRTMIEVMFTRACS